MIITPRHARDMSQLRFAMRELISRPAITHDSLIFDISGELEYSLSRFTDDSIFTLENLIWDTIYDYCHSSNELAINDIKYMFSLSDDFVQIIRKINHSRIDDIKSKTYFSFSVPLEFQDKMLYYIKNKITVNTSCDPYTIKFWSTIITIAKENEPDITSFKLGIKQDLALKLHYTPYYKTIDVLARFPIKLVPRFSELVIANIFVTDDKQSREMLFNLKHAQAASGTNTDKDNLVEKCRLLNEYESYLKE